MISLLEFGLLFLAAFALQLSQTFLSAVQTPAVNSKQSSYRKCQCTRKGLNTEGVVCNRKSLGMSDRVLHTRKSLVRTKRVLWPEWALLKCLWYAPTPGFPAGIN